MLNKSFNYVCYCFGELWNETTHLIKPKNVFIIATFECSDCINEKVSDSCTDNDANGKISPLNFFPSVQEC